MSEAEFSQNEIIKTNNDNKQEENKISSLNGQYKEFEPQNQLLNNENKNEN